jgi:hypothetical protein
VRTGFLFNRNCYPESAMIAIAQARETLSQPTGPGKKIDYVDWSGHLLETRVSNGQAYQELDTKPGRKAWLML